jgi:hypothetical protein
MIYRDPQSGQYFVLARDPATGKARITVVGQPQQQSQQGGGSNPYQMYNQYSKMSSTGGMAANPGATSPYASNAGLYGPSGTYGEGFASMGQGAGEAAGGGMGEGLSAVGGYVAALIAAQQLMSNATDRRAGTSGNKTDSSSGSGHRTGSVFSGDFFTEPWMAYANQKLGIETLTPGEKTDAAIDRFREGEGGLMDVAKTAPATGAQWFDPTGAFFYGALDDERFGKIGDVASKAIFPIHWLTQLFN